MKNPEQIQAEMQAMLAAAQQTHTYKVERAILEFTEDMVKLMQRQEVANSELAKRIDVSPAYITKILRGTTNFTLDTMVKVAGALNARFRCHLEPEGNRTVWKDYPTRQTRQLQLPLADPLAARGDDAFKPTKFPPMEPNTDENLPAAA